MATHECHGMDRQIPAAMKPAKQKYKVLSFLHSCSSTKFNWSEKLGVYILTKYVIVLVYIL